MERKGKIFRTIFLLKSLFRLINALKFDIVSYIRF